MATLVMFTLPMFQSTRPRGARHNWFYDIITRHTFQSTRPRGARRNRFLILQDNSLFQSTRPRGARPLPTQRRLPRSQVSIHAPAWGATVSVSKSRSPSESFNPRARVGRDNVTDLTITLVNGFNPRARVGRDKEREAAHADSGVCFNPRARVGRDGHPASPHGLLTRFNPRARVGRDSRREKLLRIFCRFQSTRPRGARPFLLPDGSTPS